MARMRSTKQKLKECLVSPQWREHLDEIAQGGLENIGPLFSFLLLGPQTMHRAAVALGQVTARLMQEQPESAKNIVRQHGEGKRNRLFVYRRYMDILCADN